MGEGSLESAIGELLRKHGLWLAVAESCTGGLIGHRITNIPGSSDYFLGGVIAYANRVKVARLGVAPATLEQFGAVSRETVQEMARGVRIQLDADIGLAVSGIAGPGGGSPNKPVGLVWIALSAGEQEAAGSYHWQGDREAIKAQAAEQALRLLDNYLLHLPD